MTDCEKNSNKKGAAAEVQICSSAFCLNIVMEIVHQAGLRIGYYAILSLQ